MQPHSEWEDLDFVLVSAYQVFEDEHSTSHGYALWQSRTLDPNVLVEIETVVDVIDAAVQEFDAKSASSKAKNYGQVRTARIVMADGSDVPTGGLAREAYFEEMAAIQADIDDAVGEGLGVERKRPDRGYDASEYGDPIVESSEPTTD